MVRWVVGSILHGVDPLSYIYIRIEMHNEKAQRLGSMTNNIEKKAVTNTKEAQNRKTGNYDKRH